MYNVISTGVAATILYLISIFFSRNGFYTTQDHRKLWNFILAAAFLLTISAGLFLALQITYKWNIPFIKAVLKWHVECGIGLAFTGFFHFICHLPYFSKIFGRSESPVIIYTGIQRNKAQNSLNLIIVGFVSSSVQLLLMREFMNIAGGYELITGTFLGSWLIGSAAGAAMARRSPLTDIRKINLIFALGPLITIILLIVLGRLFLHTGETPSFLLSIIYSLLTLLPFCFVSGFTFIKLINYAENNLGINAGRSFSIETAGGIAAGLTVSFLTGGVLNTYQLFMLIIILNITYLLLSFFFTLKIAKIITIVIMFLTAITVFFMKPDIFFRQQLLSGIKVMDSRDTPYGNITTGEYGNEKSIYYNQRLQTYSNDESEREENIHFAMLQHNSPKNILIISGDIESNMKEIMKYDINKVVFVERDPALISLELKNKNSLSKLLTVKNDDAFRYIRDTREDFDIVILLLPPPSTLLLNRFYTTDFFREVKNRIGRNGIFICSPGSGENYYSKESIVLYSSIYNSLASVFGNIRPIVGNKLYFVSSDGEISSSVCSLADKRGIKNVYVSSDYLSDDLLTKKSDEVIAVIDPLVKQNTLGFPVACFHYQSYNLSKNLNERIPSVIILIIIFVFPLFSVRRKNMIMFSTAAALSGFEIIILLILQTTVGNMYLLTGLVIASLMAGLASGAIMKMKIAENAVIKLAILLLIIFYICTGLLFNQLQAPGNNTVIVIILLLLVYIPSFITGQLFKTMTNSKMKYSDASSVYSADLAGSALGFVIVSGLAIPIMGIRMTIILLSSLIFAAFLFGTKWNK
jgi:spermidine synthase